MDIGFSALPELVSPLGSIGGLSHIQLVGVSGSRDKAVTKWPTVSEWWSNTTSIRAKQYKRATRSYTGTTKKSNKNLNFATELVNQDLPQSKIKLEETLLIQKPVRKMASR